MNNRSPLRGGYIDQNSNSNLYMMTRNGPNEAGFFERHEDPGYHFDITPPMYLDSQWKEWNLKFDPFEIGNLSPAMKIDMGDQDKNSESMKLCSPHQFWDQCLENVI